MSLIIKHDTGNNFWKMNPDMKVAGHFKKLYDLDKSKDKKESSLICWFIVLCYDRSSKYYRLPPEEKHNVISIDYCENSKFYDKNKSVIDNLIEEYINLQYTPLERHLKIWEDLLNKRSAFLKDQEYDLETYEALDKMAIGTEKVYATIKKVTDDMNKEAVKKVFYNPEAYDCL